MFDTEDLIREKTEYARLDSGEWQATFPGRQWRVVVAAPTLEQARADLIHAFDARLWAVICNDLDLAENQRPEALIQSARRSLGKAV